MSIEAMKQMVEALIVAAEYVEEGAEEFRRKFGRQAMDDDLMQVNDAITAGKAAIEQAEKQEPVAWYRDEDGIRIYYESKCWDDATPLYTTPPKRKWVGLTDDEAATLALETWGCASIAPQSASIFARAIEAKLREKNGGRSAP